MLAYSKLLLPLLSLTFNTSIMILLSSTSVLTKYGEDILIKLIAYPKKDNTSVVYVLICYCDGHADYEKIFFTHDLAVHAYSEYVKMYIDIAF